MKKVIFLCLVFLCSACAYQHSVFTYSFVNEKEKTIAINTENASSLQQELRYSLESAGFNVLTKNKASNYTTNARYELSDSIQSDASVNCSLFERGYSFTIAIVDLRTHNEIFNMNGRGCKEEILSDFNALIRNQYNQDYEKNKKKRKGYSAGNYLLWGGEN